MYILIVVITLVFIIAGSFIEAKRVIKKEEESK